MKGKITISKSFNDKVYIILRDEISDIDFVEVELSLEEFSKGLFGLACRPCEFETRELNKLGKERICEKFEFGISALSKSEAEQKIKELNEDPNNTEWEYSDYFGSKGSFIRRDNKTYAVTTRCKYVLHK